MEKSNLNQVTCINLTAIPAPEKHHHLHQTISSDLSKNTMNSNKNPPRQTMKHPEFQDTIIVLDFTNKQRNPSTSQTSTKNCFCTCNPYNLNLCHPINRHFYKTNKTSRAIELRSKSSNQLTSMIVLKARFKRWAKKATLELLSQQSLQSSQCKKACQVNTTLGQKSL